MNNLEHIKYFTASDGVKVAYFDCGSGQPLISFYGFTGTVNAYDFEEYVKHFRVISLAYRGAGKLTPAENMGFERIAKDTEELL